MTSAQSLCIRLAISLSRFPSYCLSSGLVKPTTITPSGPAMRQELS